MTQLLIFVFSILYQSNMSEEVSADRPINDKLFVTDSGQSLLFVMTPCLRKKELQALIEVGLWTIIPN